MCVPGIRKWSMKKNIFVEYILPRGITRTIDDVVMSHYRGVQPTPCMRVGIAELSRQLVAGRPWLATLERKVLDQLSDKPLLLIWGGSDPAFPAGHCVPRWRSAFYDCTYLYLPRARHFVQEDAPESVSGAIQTWHQGLDVPVYSNATTMIGNI